MSSAGLGVTPLVNAPAAHRCFVHGLSRAAELKNLRSETVMQLLHIVSRL